MVGIIRVYETYEKKQERSSQYDLTDLFDKGDWDGSDIPSSVFYRVNYAAYVSMDKETAIKTFSESPLVKIKEKHCLTSDLLIGKEGDYYIVSRSCEIFCNCEEALRLHKVILVMMQQLPGFSYCIHAIVPF